MRISLIQIISLIVLLTQSGSPLASQTILGPNDASLCYLESQLQFGRDPRSCNEALRHGDLTRRDQAATYSNRGIIYSKMDELEKALRDHNRAIELKPDLTQAYINRGNVFYHLRRYEEALLEYQRAIEMSEDSLYLPHYNSGIALLKLKRDDQAVIELELALEIAPELQRVKKKLAQARKIASDSE